MLFLYFYKEESTYFRIMPTLTTTSDSKHCFTFDNLEPVPEICLHSSFEEYTIELQKINPDWTILPFQYPTIEDFKLAHPEYFL